MSPALHSTLKKIGFACVLLALIVLPARADETNTNTAGSVAAVENAAPDALTRANLQLQEQIHAARLEIERTREEAQAAAAENAETLSNRLQAMEQTLTAQRVNELANLQRTNHLMLTFVVVFAAAGFAAVLLTAYFQSRAVNRLVEVASALPANRGLAAPSLAALGMNETPLLSAATVEQSNVRLLGFIEHLEKRIAELEHTASPALKAPTVTTANGNSHPTPIAPAASLESDNSKKVASLLERGQSLLNSEKAEESLTCFDELLALHGDHAEALLKKGEALEKLNKLPEAIECYDRAIAADGSLTIAYLHKGGVCNRLERFEEAMRCYEQALHAQEKKRAA